MLKNWDCSFPKNKDWNGSVVMLPLFPTRVIFEVDGLQKNVSDYQRESISWYQQPLQCNA